MFKHALGILIIIWTCTNISYAETDAGFDEICRIYTEAVNSSMKNEQLSDYIFKNIQKRVNNKDALDVHDMIFQLAPAERYKIFKQSAEMSLKRNWDCPAVKQLLE